MWPVPHGLVAWWMRSLSSMGRIWNDRLTFKMKGSCSKRQAHMWNDGLAFEMMGPHARWGAHVQNDRLTCKMMGSHSKWWACMQNDGLTFETTGLITYFFHANLAHPLSREGVVRGVGAENNHDDNMMHVWSHSNSAPDDDFSWFRASWGQNVT